MAPPLRVFLSSDGVRTLLGQLTFQQIVVGRDSPDGFTIPSPAVSREHGIFLSVDRNWFFKDLGSTNGTWLNGNKVPPGSLTHLKIGDTLQLGDSLLEMLSAEVGEQPEEVTSAIVFLRDSYAGEYFLPESGPLLIVGGPKSHLKKEVAGLELPGLVIERRGSDLTALSLDPKADVLLNEQPLKFATNLVDRDVLKIQNYSVHISLGSDLKAYNTTQVSIHEDSATFSSGGAVLKEWDEALPKRPPARTNFGKLSGDEESNTAEDRFPSAQTKPFSIKQVVSNEDNLESFEFSLVLIIGVILVVLLIGLALYWFSI